MALNKFTILFLQSSSSFIEFYEKILNHPYSQSIGYGFSPEEKNDEFFSGSYIERLERTIRTITPFGTEETQNIAEYNEIKFSIENNKKYFLLKIENAPRRKTGFFRFLTKNVDVLLTIDSAKIDILKTKDYIIEEFKPTTILYQRLKASNILLSRNTVAKIEVQSDSNAIQSAFGMARREDFLIDKLKFELRDKNFSRTFVLYKNGQIEATENDFERIKGIFKPS